MRNHRLNFNIDLSVYWGCEELTSGQCSGVSMGDLKWGVMSQKGAIKGLVCCEAPGQCELLRDISYVCVCVCFE